MLIVTPSSSCDVCLEKYSWDIATRTPHSISCGHVFCQECLRSLSPRTCPLCRRPFTVERIRKLHLDVATEDQNLLQSAIEVEERQFEDRIVAVSRDNVPDEECQAAIEEILGWLETRPPDAHRVLREWMDLVHRYKVLKESHDLILVDRDQYRRKLKRSERERTQDKELSKGIEDSLRTQIDDVKRQYDNRLSSLEIERLRIENELEQLRIAQSQKKPKLKFKRNPLPPPPKLVHIPDPLSIPALADDFVRLGHNRNHHTTIEINVQAKGAPSGYIPPSSSLATPPDSQQRAQYDPYFKNVAASDHVAQTGEIKQVQKDIVIPPRPDYMLPMHPSRTGYTRQRVGDIAANRLSRRFSGDVSFSDPALIQSQIQMPQRVSLTRSSTYAEGHPTSDFETTFPHMPSITDRDISGGLQRVRSNRQYWESDAEGLHRERSSRRRQTEPLPPPPQLQPLGRYSTALTSQNSISSSLYVPRDDSNNVNRSTDLLSQLSGFEPLRAYSETLGPQVDEPNHFSRNVDRRGSLRRSDTLHGRSGPGGEFSTELESRLAGLLDSEIGQLNEDSELTTHRMRRNTGLGSELRDAISMISGHTSGETTAATYGSLADIPIYSRPHTPVQIGSRTSAYFIDGGEAPTQDFTPIRRDVLSQNGPRTPRTPSRPNTTTWPMAAAYVDENSAEFREARYPSGYASDDALAAWMTDNV